MDGDYSFQTGQKRPLSIIDYAFILILFCIPVGIGLYHAYVGRRNSTEYEFHLAGRTLHPVPVSMSIAATFFSALTILGSPVEVYTYGLMALWMVVGCLIATIFIAHVYWPKFHQLGFTSCFEYIERRFSRGLKLLISGMYLLQTYWFCAIALYIPCLAVEAVTGVSMYTSMIIATAVCTFYTLLGGMRSVVWVDCLQLVVVVVGMLALLIEGSKATGGFINAWTIAKNRQRTLLSDISIDPRTRHTIWSLCIGYGIMLTYTYGISQTQVQRACSMSSSRKATIAAWLHFPQFALIVVITCMTGIVMFAFYSKCDPVKYGLIKKNDQLVPLFVLDVLGKKTGLPGIFLACIFSGSLSSLSSAFNAMSAVVLKDFISRTRCNKVYERRGLAISRAFVFIFGFLTFFGAVLVSYVEGLVLQLSYTFTAVVGGPVIGVFAAGLFFPWTNNLGASVGTLLSGACMIWLCIGTIVERPLNTHPLLTSTTGCNWNITDIKIIGFNLTTLSISTSSTTDSIVIQSAEPLVYNFYRISYLWYAGLGFLVNIIVTLVVSFVTGYTRPSTLDANLICPIFDVLCPWLPERIRKPLRFGIQYEKREDINESGKENEQSQTTRLMEPF